MAHTARTIMLHTLITLLAAAALLCAPAFLAEHAEHDCTGDDCPVCAVLAVVQAGLSTLHAPAPRAAQSAVSFYIIAFFPAAFALSAARTPVSDKTRMND